jgi:hypothetical protein
MPSMPIPQRIRLIVGTAVAPAGLCLGAFMPLAEMLAAAVVLGLVVLITLSGALLAADWHAETESRQAWAAVAPVWAEQRPADIQPERADIEARYRTILDSAALRQSVLPRPLPVRAAPPLAGTVMPAAGVSTLSAGPIWAGGWVSDKVERADARRDDARELLSNAGTQAAKELPLAFGHKRVGTHRTVGVRRLLAVNDRMRWSLPGDGAAKPSGLHDVCRVIVLGDPRDASAPRPADDSAGAGVGRDEAKPGLSRAPPLKKRSSVRREVMKSRRRVAPVPKSSFDDPVVVDNFGITMQVTKAELRVFETYFSDVLDEVFGSPKTGSERDRT